MLGTRIGLDTRLWEAARVKSDVGAETAFLPTSTANHAR